MLALQTSAKSTSRAAIKLVNRGAPLQQPCTMPGVAVVTCGRCCKRQVTALALHRLVEPSMFCARSHMVRFWHQHMLLTVSSKSSRRFKPRLCPFRKWSAFARMPALLGRPSMSCSICRYDSAGLVDVYVNMSIASLKPLLIDCPVPFQAVSRDLPELASLQTFQHVL